MGHRARSPSSDSLHLRRGARLWIFRSVYEALYSASQIWTWLRAAPFANVLHGWTFRLHRLSVTQDQTNIHSKVKGGLGKSREAEFPDARGAAEEGGPWHPDDDEPDARAAPRERRPALAAAHPRSAKRGAAALPLLVGLPPRLLLALVRPQSAQPGLPGLSGEAIPAVPLVAQGLQGNAGVEAVTGRRSQCGVGPTLAEDGVCGQ